MRITKLRIPAFQQFRDLDLPFTDPMTGQALDSVCFIGANGTGKTTLLRLIRGFLESLGAKDPQSSAREMTPERLLFMNAELMGAELSVLAEPLDTTFVSCPTEQGGQLRLDDPQRDRVVSVSAASGDASALPDSNLDQALRLFKDYPVFHEVSNRTADAFWTHLIFLVKRREGLWQEYLARPENRRCIVEDLEKSFDAENPEILSSIATLWNRILGPAGLEFDHESAKRPVQLTDNLEAYVRLKDDGTRITYNALSAGMRTFMFRLGHIFALHFGQAIERSFLLLDEPESSLHPDFLYDIIDVYRAAAPRCQLFVATHSPIIAAQFPPQARFILYFDEKGHVAARRGSTPEGDDPNDVLSRDFEVQNLYGPKGRQAWARFLELRTLLAETADPSQRLLLAKEYLEIGRAYNFGDDMS